MSTNAVRRLAGLVLALVGLVALSGCVITSETNLVAPAALVTPLPSSFTMYPYKEGPGGFIAADDKPISFTLTGKTYVVSDNSMTLQFEPLSGETYLVAVGGEEPGTIYGTLTYHEGVAAIRMLLSGDPSAAVDTVKASAPSGVAEDLSYNRDGLTVTRRATLDFAIGKVVAGELPTDTLIAYIGDSSATPPTAIVETDGVFAPAK
jgi:hypothetical protein